MDYDVILLTVAVLVSVVALGEPYPGRLPAAICSLRSARVAALSSALGK